MKIDENKRFSRCRIPLDPAKLQLAKSHNSRAAPLNSRICMCLAMILHSYQIDKNHPKLAQKRRKWHTNNLNLKFIPKNINTYEYVCTGNSIRVVLTKAWTETEIMNAQDMTGICLFYFQTRNYFFETAQRVHGKLTTTNLLAKKIITVVPVPR